VDSNRKRILAFIKEHKNELMIDPSFDIVKLVGFSEDDVDYYYVVFNKERGKTHVSCVGKLIPLKGALSDEDYNLMVHGWDLNPYHWAYEKVYDQKAMNKANKLMNRRS